MKLLLFTPGINPPGVRDPDAVKSIQLASSEEACILTVSPAFIVASSRKIIESLLLLNIAVNAFDPLDASKLPKALLAFVILC